MINKVSEFKDRFNKALEIRNIAPVDLSKKTKISESTISQYRSGYAKPKEKKLAIISNALNVNPAWLMGLDVPMEIVITPATLGDTQIEEAMELYKQYESLSPENQAAFRTLLKSLQS